MRMKRFWMVLLFAAPALAASAEPARPAAVSPAASDVLPGLDVRFADGDASEVPDFQRHVVPLLGRLGCNGRACHGSFQGRGGFQLSLFGYDFKADHAALLEENSGRVDVDDIDESLILTKPTDADLHEGGKRYDARSWQYHVLRSWIAAQAPQPAADPQALTRLEVQPTEIRFDQSGQSTPLRAVAHWEDGTAEDVTALCRFSTNDDAVAEIDQQGTVTAGDAGDTHVVVYYDKAVVPVPVLRPVSQLVGDNYPPTPTPTEVDRLVVQKLAKLGIVPSGICNDADFLRRVSLDLTGTLPSPQQVESFLADDSPDKRAALVQQLMDSPAYAAWWATRFSDWTGNSEAQLINVLPVRGAASQLWFKWLESRIAQNMPYDQIIAGIVTAQSRMAGEGYREYCEVMSDACREGGEEKFVERDGLPLFWARQNLRMPEEKAIGFAYAFMGIRIQCAQCHKHPFDQWSKDDFDQFTRLFAPVRLSQAPVDRQAREEQQEMLASLKTGDLKGGQLRRRLGQLLKDGKTVPFPELVVRTTPDRPAARGRRNRGNSGPARVPTGKLLGVEEQIELNQDPRESLMEWLREEQNPYFAPALVNRVWANYFGSGLVDPTDDLNLANPPVNKPLMDYLAQGFIDSGFDLRWLHRTIVLSDTYQRSYEVNETNVGDKRNFSHFIPRRLPAEVVHDAVLLATASDDQAAELRSSLDDRAIANTYLINRQGASNFALGVFGQSIRETSCDCDRSDDASLLQSVYLRNDSEIHSRLASRRGWVGEVCKELGVKGPASGPEVGNDAQQRQRRNLEAQLRQRTKQLKTLQDQQRPGQVKALRANIQRLRKRLDALGGGSGDSAESASVAPAKEPQTEQFAKVVEAAYLRTLSRYPQPNEREVALAFIQESPSAAEGIEGLMWSLINTKEFILNH